MVRALKDIVEDACSRVKLWPNDKVLDIGCNDGTLLSFYPSYVNTYGYEPAWNLWEIAKKKSRGCIYPTFFPPQITIHNKYKIITSIAQLYNVDDLNSYVGTMKKILTPDGIWIVQMQDLEGMLACNGVDNICHEHVTYFSRTSMENMLSCHGLMIIDESHNSTNGSSVRFVIAHSNTVVPPHETPCGSLYKFKMCVEENKISTMNLLHSLKLQGKSVIGLAASTKGNTLLQYYGIGPELISAIADRNPDKIDKLTVGTHIPIISEKELFALQPDYVFVLAWHFLDSFRERYKKLNTKWIVPIPELRVLEAESCLSIPVKHSGRRLEDSILEMS